MRGTWNSSGHVVNNVFVVLTIIIITGLTDGAEWVISKYKLLLQLFCARLDGQEILKDWGS